MFQPSEAVNVLIVVNGSRVAVPGITTGAEYTGTRRNPNTGSLIPTQYVDVITYHDIPAGQSRSGEARTYWKQGRQSAAFMEYRTEAIEELDDLTADELLAKVAESLAAIQQTSLRVRTALAENAAEAAIKPKAVFGVQMPLTPAPAPAKGK